MNEFARRLREQAAERLRQDFQQEATPNADPLLELTGVLLEDQAGSLLNTQQWLTWNQVILDRHEGVSQIITGLADREEMELPAEIPALRQWAANLVLMVLDELKAL